MQNEVMVSLEDPAQMRRVKEYRDDGERIYMESEQGRRNPLRAIAEQRAAQIEGKEERILVVTRDCDVKTESVEGNEHAARMKEVQRKVLDEMDKGVEELRRLGRVLDGLVGPRKTLEMELTSVDVPVYDFSNASSAEDFAKVALWRLCGARIGDSAC